MMAKVDLPHLKRMTDRHGKKRVYFKRRGYKLIPLPAEENTDAFLDAYRAALDGVAATPKAIGADRVKPGTLAALIVLYLQSPEWAALAASTKAATRRILERLRVDHGHRPVVTMQIEQVRALVRKHADKPAAANRLLKLLRALLRLAVDAGWRRDDPTRDVRPIRYRTNEIATWSNDDIALFAERWPVGTRERLALALLLFTGQRQSDVVRMGPQHVQDGRIAVRQVKTGARLLIPMHPELVTALAAHTSGHAVFLATKQGQPFSPNGVGNWLRDAMRAANLPAGLSPHGLRKAAARRLAEAGCTTLQIAAITGHRSLRELELYTRDVDQVRLADAAIENLTKTRR